MSRNSYAVGQSWTFSAPKGFESSRIVIGAIEPVDGHEPIICISIIGVIVPLANGKIEKSTIDFMPFSKKALDETVINFEGKIEIPSGFSSGYLKWKSDPDGLGFFNVPFSSLIAQLTEAMTQDENN